MKIKKLMKKEEKELRKVLDSFESITLQREGLHTTVGGYAKAKIGEGYDNGIVFIDLEFGVNGESQFHERHQILREAILLDLPLSHKVSMINLA